MELRRVRHGAGRVPLVTICLRLSRTPLRGRQETARGHLVAVKASLETMFGEAMTQRSDRYRRYTSVVLFWVGFG